MEMREKLMCFIDSLDVFPQRPIVSYVEDRVSEIQKLSKAIKRKKNKATKFKALKEYEDKLLQVTAPGCDSVQAQANSTRLSVVLEGRVEENCGNVGTKSSTLMPAPTTESRVRRAAAQISMKKCCDAVQMSIGKKLRRPTESNNSVISLNQTCAQGEGKKQASTEGDFPLCTVSLKRLSMEEIQSWHGSVEENQNGQAEEKISPTEDRSHFTTCVFPSPPSLELTSGENKQRGSVGRKMAIETTRTVVAADNSVKTTAKAVPVSNSVEEQVVLRSSKNSKATPSARKSKEPLLAVPSETASQTDTNIRRSSLRNSKEAAETASVIEIEVPEVCNVTVARNEVTDKDNGEVHKSTMKNSKLACPSTSYSTVTKSTKEVETTSLREVRSSECTTADKKSNQSVKLVEISDDEMVLDFSCVEIITTNESKNARIEHGKLPQAHINDKQTPPVRKGKLTRTKTKMPEEDPTVPEITQDTTNKRTRTKKKKMVETENHDLDTPMEGSKRTRTKTRKKKEEAEALEDCFVNQDHYSMPRQEGERSFKVASAKFSIPVASSTPRGLKRKSDWLGSPCIEEEQNAARSRTKVLSKPTVPGPPVVVHPTCSDPLVKTQAVSQTTETTRMTRTKTRQLKEASQSDIEVSSNTGSSSGAATLTNKVKIIKIDKENNMFRKPIQMPRSEMKPRTTPLKLCNNLFTPGKILPSSAKAFSSLKCNNMKRNEEYNLKIREKLEKEQIAFKKKEEHIKSVSEKAKRNREIKKKKLEAQKRMMEEEKREQENKLERERIEKELQVRAEKERQREELVKKKKLNQLKLQEAENRRQKEEQAKLLRLKEQEEEARRQAEVVKRQEQEAERLAKQRLADQQQWQNANNMVPSKPAAVNKDEYELTPARGEKPPMPPKSDTDYGISDCDTDESSDDENSPKKVVPVWAEGGSRRLAVQVQDMVTPDVFTKLMVVENKAPTSRELLQVDMQRPRNSSFHWPSSPI